MRATTGSVGSQLALRPIVLGCALAVVAGCSGSSSGDSASSTPLPSTSAGVPSSSAPVATAVPSEPVVETPPGGQVFEIFVSGNRVAPKPSRHTVKPGEKVRLVVTTDKANVVHVHGADVERDVKPGVPLTIDFSIDDPGVYPIELHEPELLLSQIVVR